MTQILDEALASPEWAFALAESLEQLLGDDRILTVGTRRDALEHIAADRPARAVAQRFTTDDGQPGSLALLAFPAFADALERSASDELFVSACTPGFGAAARVIGEQTVTGIDVDAVREIDAEVLADETAESESVYPLLDGSDLVGVVVLRVGRRAAPRDAGTSTIGEPEVAASGAGAGNSSDRAPYVLADVEMGVTAELGRCRMTVRELLSITPGALIDLDRPAGAPVDVLVNGTLIARGEVVVIDEEFGIRISELVPQPSAARSRAV
jgi:flagellar motor switch protein FliN/FliY